MKIVSSRIQLHDVYGYMEFKPEPVSTKCSFSWHVELLALTNGFSNYYSTQIIGNLQ